MTTSSLFQIQTSLIGSFIKIQLIIGTSRTKHMVNFRSRLITTLRWMSGWRKREYWKICLNWIWIGRRLCNNRRLVLLSLGQGMKEIICQWAHYSRRILIRLSQARVGHFQKCTTALVVLGCVKFRKGSFSYQILLYQGKSTDTLRTEVTKPTQSKKQPVTTQSMGTQPRQHKDMKQQKPANKQNHPILLQNHTNRPQSCQRLSQRSHPTPLWASTIKMRHKAWDPKSTYQNR